MPHCSSLLLVVPRCFSYCSSSRLVAATRLVIHSRPFRHLARKQAVLLMSHLASCLVPRTLFSVRTSSLHKRQALILPLILPLILLLILPLLACASPKLGVVLFGILVSKGNAVIFCGFGDLEQGCTILCMYMYILWYTW